MKGRRRLQILAIVTVNLTALVFLEIAVRIACWQRYLHLPSTAVQGFDQLHTGRNATAEQRLIQDDRDLLYRMRSNFDRQYRRMSVYSWLDPEYTVRTNARGFRTPPFAQHKAADVFRIVCLGDSSTFGMNVEERDAYPRLLARDLEVAYRGRFEVINLAIPGYSSRQGLELLRQEVLGLEPDLVTLAFGTNDRAFWSWFDDDATIRFNQSLTGGVLFALRQLLDHVYLYRLVRSGVPRMAYWLFEEQQRRRVSVDGLRDAIVMAHQLLAPRGIELIVLNTDFFETDAIGGLRAGAQRSGVEFLDLPDMVRMARREKSRERAAARNLPPVERRPGQTIFRVEAPGTTNVSIELGVGGKPRTVFPLRDDGKGGDQVAGDAVWSGPVPVQAGNKVQYFYRQQSDGSRSLKEFRDGFPFNKQVRQMVVEADEPIIDVFGYPLFMSDPTHPDEQGHRMIATHLLEALRRNAKVRAFLTSAATPSG